LSMARLGERHGQTETAHKIYEKVLLQDADNVEALHRLGVMAAKTQDYETAISYLTKAEMNDPSNVELLNDLGYALFLTDDLAGAEEKLRLAIRLNPSHRAARNNLGLVLGNAGRWDECMVQFKRAVSEAEAYANLAFVQVQMGEFALAEKNFHSALDLDDELDAAAEGLVQILAKKDMLEKRFIADFNEQSAKPSVEHQTVERVPTVVQPLSPSRYQLRASEVSQTPSVVAAKPQNTINSPNPAEAVPFRKKAPEVIAETPLRAEPKLTQQISQGPVTRANRQVILEHKLPFQPRLRHDAIAQTPLTQTPAVEVEAPVVAEAPIQMQTPVQIEAPVVAEAPIQMQTPVEAEASVVVEAPVVIDAPVVMQTPVQIEAPVTIEKSFARQKSIEIKRGPSAPLPATTVSSTDFKANHVQMTVQASQDVSVQKLDSPLDTKILYDLPKITSATVINELPAVVREPLTPQSSRLASQTRAITNLETHVIPVQVESVHQPTEPSAVKVENISMRPETGQALESAIITAAQPTLLNGKARAAKVEPVNVVPVNVREIEVRKIEINPVKIEPVSIKIPSSLQPVTIKPVTPELDTKESAKAKPIPRPSIWD
ncbi:MAG: tetratricopeptide repeat protein, partial [Planctomycetota bacterium]|nr:tetratricopeptide repeat protein [Planctomycetota bacterium]